uniref:Leukocyte immunoglobulin-like receptor subfamily A member 6 n=1 Tax=Marmota marmota marmota TaxID=9994 RepID=A0A8C6EMZ6_MARMA
MRWARACGARGRAGSGTGLRQAPLVQAGSASFLLRRGQGRGQEVDGESSLPGLLGLSGEHEEGLPGVWTFCLGSVSVPGSLRKPSIWAVPGPVVPQGSPVSIFCRGPPGAARQRLQQVGGSRVWAAESLGDAQAEAAFSFQQATPGHSGTYVCQFKTQDSWSERSDPLELLVVGVYKKPQLSAVQGPCGAPQHMTTLQCRSEMWFDLFLLSQEGSANVTQRLRSQYKRGFFQANFTLNASEQARGATYRCYGSLSSFPSLWSDPSEPLRLSGRGSAAWNSYKVNMLRLSLAGVILLILLGFLVEAWLSRRDPRGAVERPPALPDGDRVL